ncbi:MAG: HD domain-containing protein [Pseudomonadota bacterium]|nr:HD domain-containing protein [Pseudomonadota bacterium]
MATRESLAEAEALLLEAVAFAAEKHRHQRRKDARASPYINHPIELAILLQREGVTDPVTLCAALLHDTIEDTETTPQELESAFGSAVAGVVLEVTDDQHLSKERRKELQIEHAHQLSARARAVKLADKICNLRDIVKSPPAGWSLARRQEYFEWAKAVIDNLRGHHPALESLFDHVHAEGVRALATTGTT